MLSIENLTFRYDRSGLPVLRGASLQLEQGQIGILLGKNGSGKTTLFKNILGINKPNGGRILFDGEDYTVQEFEVPFRYETDAPAEEVCEFDAVADVISCRARIDGERIGVDAELAVCLSTRGEYRLQTLTEARFTALPAHTGAHFTVCYPSREDTLWSVAKRYHRSVSVIAEQNELAGAPAADARESLAGVTYLLV